MDLLPVQLSNRSYLDRAVARSLIHPIIQRGRTPSLYLEQDGERLLGGPTPCQKVLGLIPNVNNRRPVGVLVQGYG